MPYSNKIPINAQRNTAVGGLDVIYLKSNTSELRSLKEHRDEYYTLAIVKKGAGFLKCDMGSIQIFPMSIILIKPFQIHCGHFNDDDNEGYFISIAPFLVPPFCRNVFDDMDTNEQFKRLLVSDMKALLKTASLVYDAFKSDNIYKVQITINLLNALLISACSFFSSAKPKLGRKVNQAAILTGNFKNLVIKHSFKHIPSYYAEKLHITTSHLNECMKSTMGISVTQYLQQSMLLEAKRLLYYTNEDVKRIAYTLGFDDHTYFSRLFKKLTKETPLGFRNRFHE